MRRDPTRQTKPQMPPATAVRAAMLDLLSRLGDAASVRDEAELLAGLRAALVAGRGHADELRDQYHRPDRDRLARLYARYGD